MTEPSGNIITMTEIQRITRHCLNLLTYTSRLRHNEETAEAHAQAQALFAPLRKLVISSLMYRKTLICVSGLQGAGKTTLMKNFYGLRGRYLSSTLGRGERLAVLITEKQGISSPSAWAVRIEEDENGDYVQREESLTEEEFARSVTGEDERVMYLELRVPFLHTHREGLSFLLLPGFEPERESNGYWNDLIEFSINSSDAAVFVFNEPSFSKADNEDCLKRIEKRFGKNLVYAITRTDESGDGNASFKETCLQVLNIPDSQADRVVCAGEYSDQAQNEAWIKDFKNALARYAYTDMQQLDNNSQYLYREVKEISDSLYQIQGTLNQASGTMQMVDHHNDSMLKAFDEAVKKQRTNVERELDEQFKAAKKQSADNLYEQFSSTPKVSMLKRLFLGNDLKQIKKTEEIVMGSLQGGDKDCPLPTKHLGLALRSSLTCMDQPEGKTNLGRLVSGDTEKIGEEQQLQLMCGEHLKAVANDVRVLLSEPGRGEPAALQCKKDKYLMRSMAELATYYFSMASYDQVTAGTGLGAYEPAKISTLPKSMLSGADASKKFMAGMAGMMGVDLLGDGTINLVSQIAGSFGVAVPVAGAVAVTAIVGGAIAAATRDLTRMQREDYTSAVLAVGEVYDQIKLDALEKYDRYMERIRERMEDNLDGARPGGGQLIDLYNAQREITMALELLRNIEERVQTDAFAPWRRPG